MFRSFLFNTILQHALKICFLFIAWLLLSTIQDKALILQNEFLPTVQRN